jgi:polyisoprenoid-binding protein YceI
MKMRRARALGGSALAVAALAVFLSTAAAPPRPQGANPQAAVSEIVLTVDPAQSKVHWNLDSTLHTVHGTFLVKGGVVHFDPATGKAGGEVVVMTASGESGNNSRDARMHQEILETAKYPEAVFRPRQVEGNVNTIGPSDVKLRGTFTIHGTNHDLTALIHAELAGDHWTGNGKFEVPYIQWGIKDPSNFLLKVKRIVNVELDMAGNLNSTK